MSRTAGAAALIGREHPLAVLRGELERLLTGRGGIVLVAGEAGIGKTTLVAEFTALAREAGARVLTGSCWSGDGAPGYWPWVQVTRGLARAASTAEWTAAAEAAGDGLPALLGEQGTAEAAHSAFLLHDSFTRLLVTAAQSRPTVVVLDDLHWADAASVRLLEFVAQHTVLEPVLLVGTYRDTEVDAPDHPLGPLLLPLLRRATSVPLSGLSPEEVGELITRSTGEPADAERIAEVHRHTGGNPFFVEQTARLGAGAPGQPAPAGVRDAVQRRLEPLPRPARALLDIASAAGHEFDLALLGTAAGTSRSAARAALEPALTAGLVRRIDEGRWAFTHDLVRDHLYRAMARPEAAHAALLGALRSPTVPADGSRAAALAHHARLAVPLVDPADAVELLAEAARDARRRLAPEEAVRHYRAALELVPSDQSERRAALELALGVVLDFAGDLNGSRDTLNRVVEAGREHGDAELVARAALALHRLGSPAHDDPRREIRLMDEALAGLEASTRPDPALLERLLAAASMARTHKAMEREQAAALAERAVGLARARGDDEALGWCLLAQHDAAWESGTATARLAVLDELSTAARTAGDGELEALALFLRTLAHLELGDPSAHEEFAAFERLTERTRLPRHRFLAVSRRGMLDMLTGSFDRARRLVDEALALGEQVGETDRERVWRDQVWSLELLRGDVDAARAVLHAVTPGDPFNEYLAAFLPTHGPLPLSVARSRLAAVEPVAAALARRFSSMYQVLLAHLAAETGDPDLCARAEEALAPVLPHWAVISGGVLLGPMHYWAGRVASARGATAEAVAAFRAAEVAADRLGARPWAVLARARWAGISMGGAGGVSQAEAATALDSARREAEQLGMARALTWLRPDQPSSSSSPSAPPRSSGLSAPSAPAGSSGLSAPAELRAPPPPSDAGLTGPPRADAGPNDTAPGEFRFDGQVWTLRYAGRTVHLPDAKGLRDLHTLLSHPGTDIPAVELLNPGGEPAIRQSRQLGADPVLDDQARTAYRDRLLRLEAEIEAALDRGDDRRAAAFDRERSALIEELGRATGLGGRARRLGDDGERARQAVTARIRDSLRRLRKVHPELADLLTAAVSTGLRCRYDPPADATWRL